MSPRQHLLTAAIVWLVLSVVGVVVVLGRQVLPQIASREADIENGAFVLLTAVSVPVLMLVLVALGYSALRFRVGDATGDGPPLHGHTAAQAVWVGTSLILVLGLFAYGALGVLDIRGAQAADFEINVIAEQWKWHFEYPAAGVKSDELHVPVGARVHLSITSIDVIHSFWVPAFGIKQDAVPGRITQAYVTVHTAGTYGGVCAELCGLGHTNMHVTVTASDRAAVDAWLSQQPKAPTSGSPPPQESPR
jgi:cytochrome c oxidase subunit 2